MTTQQPTASTGSANGSGAETLTVTDNRTGQTYELPITDGTVRAAALRPRRRLAVTRIQGRPEIRVSRIPWHRQVRHNPRESVHDH